MGELAKTEHRHQNREAPDGATVEGTPETPTPPKKTFVQELAVFTGTYEKANIIKLLVGPFITLLNIGTCWEAVVSAILTMWYVTSGISQAAIFAGPPWNFNAAQVGYLSTGPFVGGLIGSAVMFLTSDPIAKWMTKLNKGI